MNDVHDWYQAEVKTAANMTFRTELCVASSDVVVVVFSALSGRCAVRENSDVKLTLS